MGGQARILCLLQSKSIMRFIRFAVKWVGNNLAVPFWVVGHVHLSVNVYKDVVEIVSSVGMNVVVLIALWLDWKDSNNT